MQYVVTGAPDGDVKYYTVIENGKILENSLGEDPAGRVHADRRPMTTRSRCCKGELDANAAFMQGKMKVTGNMGKLMSLMPLTQSPEYKAIQTKVADRPSY